MQSALTEKGIELSTDDIVKVRDFIAKRLEIGDELTDDELEGVAGGSIMLLIYGLAAGTAILGGISFLGIAGTVAGTFLGKKV